MKLTPLDNKLFEFTTDKEKNSLKDFFFWWPAIHRANTLLEEKSETTKEELIKTFDYGLNKSFDTGENRVMVGKLLWRFVRIGGINHGVNLFYFQYLFDQHKDEKRKLEDMAWGYSEIKENLHNAAKRIRRGTFSKYDRSDIFRNFIGTLLSAVVFCLSLFFMDGGLEKLVDRVEWGYNIEGFLMMLDSLLRFGSWFVLFIAGAATLIFLFCTIGAISNARKSRYNNLIDAYLNAVRFIRIRILWFQDAYNTNSVLPFLAEAEAELWKETRGVRRIIRKKLGRDYLLKKQKYQLGEFK